jgi:acetyl esterase/lipase
MQAASYLQGAIDAADSRVAPLQADLSGLPPMMIHAAADESLRTDAERLATRAAQQGAEVALEIFDDAPHDMLMFGDLAVTRQSLALLRKFA